MPTTIKGLRTALKKANRWADKAIRRYIDTLALLYMHCYTSMPPNQLVHASRCLSYAHGELYIREFATEMSHDFYRIGRGEKFLVEQWGEFVNAKCVPFDWRNLQKLENAIDEAVDERERIKDKLESLGHDVWNDSELWI